MSVVLFTSITVRITSTATPSSASTPSVVTALRGTFAAKTVCTFVFTMFTII